MAFESDSTADVTPGNNRKSNTIKLVVFLGLVAIVAFLTHRYHLNEYVSLTYIRERLDVLTAWAHRPYGPVIFVLCAALFILFHLPEIVVIIIGGMIYTNFWEALVILWLGCNAGISAAFVIARFFLRDYFKPILDNSFLKKYDEKLAKEGFLVIVVLRLVLFLFPPLTWAIGASAIKTRDYLVGSSIGVTPWLIAILLTLSQIQEAESFGDLMNAKTVGIAGMFGVAIFVILFLRRKYFSDR